MNVKLNPFTVPNYVLVAVPAMEGQHSQSLSFPLQNVEASELSDMCDDFRRNVFSKAKKKDPKAS